MYHHHHHHGGLENEDPFSSVIHFFSFWTSWAIAGLSVCVPAGDCVVRGVCGRAGGSLGTEVLGVDGVAKDVDVFVDASSLLLVLGRSQVSGHHWR